MKITIQLLIFFALSQGWWNQSSNCLSRFRRSKTLPPILLLHSAYPHRFLELPTSQYSNLGYFLNSSQKLDRRNQILENDANGQWDLQSRERRVGASSKFSDLRCAQSKTAAGTVSADIKVAEKLDKSAAAGRFSHILGRYNLMLEVKRLPF